MGDICLWSGFVNLLAENSGNNMQNESFATPARFRLNLCEIVEVIRLDSLQEFLRNDILKTKHS